MNAIALVFFLVNAGLLLALPRRWAPVPLLIGCCYMTTGQGVELGPISLPVIRMLLAVGLLRVVVRGERAAGGANKMDWLVIAFGGWTLFASFFHDGVDAGPLYASGVVFNIALVYYLTRVFCRTTDELVGLIKIIALILVPVAIEMLMEKATGKNLFAELFGGTGSEVVERDGRLRARGPFRHAILAGTVGAACFPLMLGIRRQAPWVARLGLLATFLMVVLSASSGPVMSWLFALVAVGFWYFRRWARYLPVAFLGFYLLMELLMNKPAYHLMARIDLAGGSTGWHRAALIDSAIRYLSDWWLFGTDFTRHWMPTGITYSPNHTDITNYYLGFGVLAGLPAMLLVLVIVGLAFRWMERAAVRAPKDLLARPDRWLIWCVGAALFAHATAALSVPYFDQSFVFFWFTVAVISSFQSVLARARRRARRAQRQARQAVGAERAATPPSVRPGPFPAGASR
jgi:hypothetical protein